MCNETGKIMNWLFSQKQRNAFLHKHSSLLQNVCLIFFSFRVRSQMGVEESYNLLANLSSVSAIGILDLSPDGASL